MSCVIYSCKNPGEVKKLSLNEYREPYVTAQFCIVKKYEILYTDALPRFAKHENTPYGLPARNKVMRIYCGIDRDPLQYTPDDFHEYTETQCVSYYASLSGQDVQLIWIRVAGCDDRVPEGATFLGYDAAWVFGFGLSDGFSAICDCLFLCRWHGCDQGGTEFLPEFQRLNGNGLFDRAEDAEAYLIHYLRQDWAEQGEYLIYGIYAY